MSDVAVVVPVVGRPQNALPFMETVQTPAVYAVCEIDDISSIQAWQDAGAHVIISDTAKTFAEKVNLGYRETTEPWLLLVGDDVTFHMGWQDELLRVAAQTGAQVIGTNDLMAPGERIVHPVIAREYIDTLGASWDGPGTVCHEGYFHWFVDDEIAAVARQRQVWAYAPDAVIEHLHPLVQKADDDEVYRRGADADRVRHDRQLFAARRAKYQPVRIAVYTCALNEEKHVNRWADAHKDADVLCVLDTGSTDNTVQLAQDAGIITEKKTFTPFRFDHARNAALAMIPEDIDVCVSVDMDEILQPGWRQTIEEQYRAGCTLFPAEIQAGTVFRAPRAHARHGFEWVYPCHEVVHSTTDTVVTASAPIRIDHHPDNTKSRGQYLGLLQLAYDENPDSRNTMYLAREHMFHGHVEDAVTLYRKYLEIGTWLDERSDAMLRLATLVPEEAEVWLLRACGEAPWRREPWVSLAQARADEGDWYGCLAAVRRALQMDRHPHYFAEPYAYGSNPLDLAARACWNLGLHKQACQYGLDALQQAPHDERLQHNLRWYVDSLA